MSHPRALHAPVQAVTSEAFRYVFAQLPTGVTIVTSNCPDGTSPCGMTASAVCSLSLHPLMVLVCLNNHSRTLAGIRFNGGFALNLLRHDQAPLAEQFADAAISQSDRFARTRHHQTDALPVLSDALAWLTCQVAHMHPGGDHTIVTATVRSIGSGGSPGGSPPLVWHNRKFTTLA
ncbi:MULTISPECIES: flavin reductase family protein [Streptomyces violaceusniger group]|uniref:Flavin reductase like domain-containing protein n=2 Tax=Streptomyces rhizosphaericus TaxID=114699 RepID=A0ABN1QSW3_9ACTN|nr:MULTISPECIES: flavin reductase family protein [Streptomyces violaceusniger group]